MRCESKEIDEHDGPEHASAAQNSAAPPAADTNPRTSNNKAELTTSVCNHRGQALPTVFLLGIQKGGTTTLMADMKESISVLLHPAQPKEWPIERGKQWKGGGGKEIHFFDHRERFAQGAELYSAYFPPCADVRAAGLVPFDGTPDYFGSQGLPVIVGETKM